MKSIVGRPQSTTEKGTKYIYQACGVKVEEGQKRPTYGTEQEAYNTFFQTLLDDMKANKDKDIVWRRFPTSSYQTESESTHDPYTFIVSARYCFE